MPPKYQKPEALAASSSTQQESLMTYKKALIIEGGIVKDAEEARKHLDTIGLATPDAEITYESITKILLSLVVTTMTK